MTFRAVCSRCSVPMLFGQREPVLVRVGQGVWGPMCRECRSHEGAGEPMSVADYLTVASDGDQGIANIVGMYADKIDEERCGHF